MLGCFSVGASAADEASGNLVDPNILNWSNSLYTSISSVNGVNRIYASTVDTSTDSTVSIKYYGCFDLTSLTVGHSYSVSLHFPSVSEINSALSTNLTSSQITSSLNAANVYVKFGIGYHSPGNLITVDDFCYEFHGSEYSSYLGETVTFDFDYTTRSSTGNPVFVIVIKTLNVDTISRILYFSNPVLKDNDADNTVGFFNHLIEFCSNMNGDRNQVIVNDIVKLDNISKIE